MPRVARAVVAAALACCAVSLAACEAAPPPVQPGAVHEDAPVKNDREQVQVIVRLRFEAPAGAAPGDEAYEQAVRAARERFLATLDFEHRVVRTYDTLPLVALVIPRAERENVARSPLVAGVEDDRLNAPLAQ